MPDSINEVSEASSREKKKKHCNGAFFFPLANFTCAPQRCAAHGKQRKAPENLAFFGEAAVPLLLHVQICTFTYVNDCLFKQPGRVSAVGTSCKQNVIHLKGYKVKNFLLRFTTFIN